MAQEGTYVQLDFNKPGDLEFYRQMIGRHNKDGEPNPLKKERSRPEGEWDVLVPRRQDIFAYNGRTVEKIPTGPKTDARVFYAQGNLVNPFHDIVANITQLNKTEPAGVHYALPPYKLVLKPGQIMELIRNLDPDMGLCSGARVMIRRMSPKGLEVTLVAGEHKGKRVCVPRVPLAAIEYGGGDMMYTRLQFPLRHIVADTIARSQGETYEALKVDLCKTVVPHRAFCVAMSRTKDPNNTEVSGTDGKPGTVRVSY